MAKTRWRRKLESSDRASSGERSPRDFSNTGTKSCWALAIRPEAKYRPGWPNTRPRIRARKREPSARAAVFGEIVVLAVKGLAVEEVLMQAGPDHLTGKIVIDTTNPLASEAPVDGILTFSTGPNAVSRREGAEAAPEHPYREGFQQCRRRAHDPSEIRAGHADHVPVRQQSRRQSRGFRHLRAVWLGTVTTAETSRHRRALEPLCILWSLPGFLRNDWRHAFKMLTK